eukprot:CAMPEP_0113937516 /NCGR_PEP_ID=MMETSP1339-20121228/4128_1 /TAXON_ID=94617 /ORGANISM="Fibrocapsa japonica" /LENGTH=444 /DNA_ID=CAMNT_0000940315 /DNA_START=76 /DNA_END=1410 /DNA_ORIENTATION=+ /assembly_acc=CAM_ASM_000762
MARHSSYYARCAVLAALLCSVNAFVPSARSAMPVRSRVVMAQQKEGNGLEEFGRNLAAAALSFSLLAGPVAAPLSVLTSSPPAVHAVSAAGSGSRVNKDAESLLRYGLPINSKAVRQIQASVEEAKDSIKTKRWGPALDAVRKAKTITTSKSKDLLAAVRPSAKAEGQAAIDALLASLDPLIDILQVKEGTGTVMEREKLDKAYAAQQIAAENVGTLEELMVPDGYKVNVPEEYKGLPQLQGRGTVEFVFVKEDGRPFDVEGNLVQEAKLTMVLDGYTAPVTAGNIMDLVDKNFYKDLKITRSDGFVVQLGDRDPEGDVHGYVPPGKKQERTVPLEVFLVGDKEPLYGITSEDEGRGATSTVLPFQSYGALGMARSEGDPDSASSQFFYLLFDSDLTPAGKNLLDGRYSAFGYTIEGAELLKNVEEGDIIKSAKVIKGLENLKR